MEFLENHQKGAPHVLPFYEQLTLANLFMWDLIRGFFGKIPILRSTIKWPHHFLAHRLSKVLILTNIATSTMYSHSYFSKYFNLLYMVDVKPRRSPISQGGLDRAFINILLIGSYCRYDGTTCKRGNTQARQQRQTTTI